MNTETRKRTEYDSISTETRRDLVRMVVNEGVTIRQAAKLLNIKYSTGKTLM